MSQDIVGQINDSAQPVKKKGVDSMITIVINMIMMFITLIIKIVLIVVNLNEEKSKLMVLMVGE